MAYGQSKLANILHVKELSRRHKLDADEVVEAVVAQHPIAPDALEDSDDVPVHVQKPHVAALDGFFLLEGSGVDEERALVGLVRGGEDRSRHPLDTHRNRQTDLTCVWEGMLKTAW